MTTGIGMMSPNFNQVVTCTSSDGEKWIIRGRGSLAYGVTYHTLEETK